MKIYLPDVVGVGYRRFWDYKGRYRVVKGSRASKKSKTTALNLLVRMMNYPLANALVVRKVYRTLKDSCFAELKWAAQRLGVASFWECKESPLEMVYIPTGQKIVFRGLDDPMKITSIATERGCLCWMWIEEAYELSHEEDFDLLDECVRGAAPAGYFKQITLTFNPWNDRHWLKKRFFDKENDNVLALTTDYRCNEWLDEADWQVFERMKADNPARYRVAGLGHWGTCDGLVFENWQEVDFDLHNLSRVFPGAVPMFGLDFGYTHDPTALFCGLLDEDNGRIVVFDEIYERKLTNREIYRRIVDRGYHKAVILADCAEPKSIDELRELGLERIRAARKGADSIRAGIQFICNFKILVHPRCTQFLLEIGNYAWDRDPFGRAVNVPKDDFNHLMDAMRYALSERMKGNVFSFE